MCLIDDRARLLMIDMILCILLEAGDEIEPAKRSPRGNFCRKRSRVALGWAGTLDGVAKLIFNMLI
jgi:hypothetical protein